MNDQQQPAPTETPAPTPKIKRYTRPGMDRILALFPPEHRAHLEYSIQTIAAATPFASHPIDALAAGVHRLAEDLRRMLLATDSSLSDDDPQKIIALAAIAQAAKQNVIQPEKNKLRRILAAVATDPRPPSTTEDSKDESVKNKRERLERKIKSIETAANRRETKAESEAIARVAAERERERRRKIKETAGIKRRCGG
jgi:hypothetical protein